VVFGIADLPAQLARAGIDGFDRRMGIAHPGSHRHTQRDLQRKLPLGSFRRVRKGMEQRQRVGKVVSRFGVGREPHRVLSCQPSILKCLLCHSRFLEVPGYLPGNAS